METAREILARIHAIHLQAMHEIGSVQELDRTLASTLMAEFVRLQLIISEDLTRSLIAFHTDLETSCEVLSSDFARTLNLHPDDPVSRQVKAIIQKFQQSTSMKMNLPLMELGETPCLYPCSTLEVLRLLTRAALGSQRRIEPQEDTSLSLLECTGGPSPP